jgi:hypothetical protein
MAKTHIIRRGIKAKNGNALVNEMTFTSLSRWVQLHVWVGMICSLPLVRVHCIRGYTSLGSKLAHAAAVALRRSACSVSIIVTAEKGSYASGSRSKSGSFFDFLDGAELVVARLPAGLLNQGWLTPTNALGSCWGWDSGHHSELPEEWLLCPADLERSTQIQMKTAASNIMKKLTCISQCCFLHQGLCAQFLTHDAELMHVQIFLSASKYISQYCTTAHVLP